MGEEPWEAEMWKRNPARRKYGRDTSGGGNVEANELDRESCQASSQASERENRKPQARANELDKEFYDPPNQG